MNALPQIYQDAVKNIKQAILESQYRSAKMISGEHSRCTLASDATCQSIPV